ncbi:MAG: DUF4834 family protein [Prevotellaceae bacterium]|nr:DUF4834 family protein [Prevotellaceae bacterium]
MLQILIFILVFILIFFIVITSVATRLLAWIVRSIKGLFFGNSNDYNQEKPTTHNPQPKTEKKIFQKDEGEYVDYENV